LGNQEGGIIDCGLSETDKGRLDIYVKKRLWQQATLSIGAPLGNLEERVHLPGVLRYSNNWAPFLGPTES
jgi:hypothetical protein